jgi:hypothetical protein
MEQETLAIAKEAMEAVEQEAKDPFLAVDEDEDIQTPDTDTLEDETPKKGDSEEEDSEEESEDTLEKSDEDILTAEEKDLSEAELARREELITKQEEDNKRILAADEATLTEEEKAIKQELVKAQDDTKETETVDRVKKFAQDEGVSEEEARQELERIDRVKEKYNGDIDKIARANLHVQRRATKAEEDLKRAREEAPVQELTADRVAQDILNGAFIPNGKKAYNREEVIQWFRSGNPGITEKLEDDAVFAMATRDIAMTYNKNRKSQEEKLEITAKENMLTQLSKVKESDKKFLPEAKEILGNLNAASLSQPDCVDVALWIAKGRKYDADLEAARKEASQKVKTRIIRIPQSGSTKSSTTGSGLSSNDKTNAKRMFPDVEEEEAYKMYKEIKPSMK